MRQRAGSFQVVPTRPVNPALYPSDIIHQTSKSSSFFPLYRLIRGGLDVSGGKNYQKWWFSSLDVKIDSLQMIHIYEIYKLFQSPFSQYLADYAKASAEVLHVRKKIKDYGSTPQYQQELQAALAALDAEYDNIKSKYNALTVKVESFESLNSIVEADYKATR